MITVVVPVYNIEQYIDRCVQSIVEQTYSSLEIILVDDGSTDKSNILCDKWAQKDKRIRVLHKKNGGLSSARNAGIDVAHGSYITFVDGDDYIEPNMYETMLSELKKHKADIVCAGRFTHIGEKQIKEEYTIETASEYSNAKAVEKVLYNSEIDVAAWDKLYKIEIFDNLRYPIGIINEDAAIIFQVLYRANKIVHCGKPLYHYVYRTNSISKAKYTSKKYDVYKNCVSISNFIRENFDKQENACKVYCSLCAAGVLQTIYDTPGAKKKFKNEYLDFRRLLRDGIFILIKTPEVSFKTRIWSFMMYLNLNHLYKLIRKVNSIWKSF